jgi:hypothetical protein
MLIKGIKRKKANSASQKIYRILLYVKILYNNRKK